MIMNKIGEIAVATGVIMVAFAIVYWAWICHYSFGIFVLGLVLALFGILVLTNK